MRKLSVKLDVFDLLHWAGKQPGTNEEIATIRNTIINFLGLFEHWHKSDPCVVCEQPQQVYISGSDSDLVFYAEDAKRSDKRYLAVLRQLEKSGLDESFLYSAFGSPESTTLLRAVASKVSINDDGTESYPKKAVISVLGSSSPIYLESNHFGPTGFDKDITLNLFIGFGSDWEPQNVAASNAAASFVKESLENEVVGNLSLPTTIHQLDADIMAIGGIIENERDIVSVEKHRVMNAAKSHPILGRLASGNEKWRVISEGEGREINEIIRLALSTNEDPSLTADEASRFASIVFSKRGQLSIV